MRFDLPNCLQHLPGKMKPMKQKIFAGIASLVLGSALAGAPDVTTIEKVAVPGIENFSLLEGTHTFAGEPVGFGGATLPTAMPWLREQGFSTVINLRLVGEEGADADNSRAAAEAAGLNYIHLPFNAGNPDPDVVENFLAAVGDKANQPVYIHCGSATRVAALWMVGRVLKDGWAIDAAAEEAELIALKPDDAIAFATAYIADLGN